SMVTDPSSREGVVERRRICSSRECGYIFRTVEFIVGDAARKAKNRMKLANLCSAICETY
ncbi:MAG: hypothetical protein ABF370_14290, partial [Verrucomicrobiales bacterium]